MKFTSFVLFLCITGIVSAQDTCRLKISGTLKDSHTAEPLSFAKIYVEELRDGVLSDENGYFEINKLCSGSYVLKITHPGCHPMTRKVALTDQPLTLDLKLDHSAHELGEVEITALKKKNIPGHTAEKLEGAELEKRTGQNLAGVLSRIPGMSALQTGSNIAKPVLQGLHSNRLLILNNGIRQEGQQWGIEHAPEIDPQIAGSITVVKGAQAVRYGADAIGGVVIVEPLPLPDSSGFGSQVRLGGASNGRMGYASASMQGNMNKMANIRFRLQGTLQRSGNLNTANYFLKNTGAGEGNYSITLAKHTRWLESELYFSRFANKIGILSAAHIGNTTDLQKAFSLSRPADSSGFSYEIGRPFQQARHELLKAKTVVKLNNLNMLQLVYGRQYNNRQEFDKHRPRNDSLAALNRPEFEYKITTHTLDIEYKLHDHHGLGGSFGINGLEQLNTYSGRYFIPNFRNYGCGAFFLEHYQAGRWQLEAGIRADRRYLEVYRNVKGFEYTNYHRYFALSGSAGVTYRVNEAISLLANSGTAWRPPAPNELYSDGLHHGSATLEKGDSTLLEEKAWNSQLTAQVKKEKLQLAATFFLNHIDNFINLVPSGETMLTIRGAFPKYIYQQQDAVFKGADLSATINFPFVRLHLQHNLVRALNRHTEEHLPLIPPDRSRGGISWNSKNTGKALYYAGLYANYHYRQSRVPEQFLIRNEAGTLAKVSDFAPPPPACTLFDLEAGTALTIGKTELQLHLVIENLLNRSYRSYMNRFRYFADDTGRNIRISLSVPLNFKSKN